MGLCGVCCLRRVTSACAIRLWFDTTEYTGVRKSLIGLLSWQMLNVTVIPHRHIFHGMAEFISMIKREKLFSRSFSKKRRLIRMYTVCYFVLIFD